MYYPDLTTYQYIPGKQYATFLNIGWLKKGHEFATGECPEPFIRRLFELCLHPVDRCMGLHECDLCPPVEMKLFDFGDGSVLRPANTQKYHLKDGRTVWTEQLFIQGDDVEGYLGDAEVEVKGEDGQVYRAPTLIYHYITEHGYLPPREFIDAVLVTQVCRMNESPLP